jgi:hypothetical protein
MRIALIMMVESFNVVLLFFLIALKINPISAKNIAKSKRMSEARSL